MKLRGATIGVLIIVVIGVFIVGGYQIFTGGFSERIKDRGIVDIGGKDSGIGGNGDRLAGSDDLDGDIGFSGGSGGSGGGGGGSGGAAGAGNVVCNDVQISYALKNFNTTQECKKMTSGVCIEKMVTCTVDVHNLDDEGGGNFNIMIRIQKEEIGVVNEIDSKIITKGVESRKIVIFKGEFKVVSTGFEGNANKKLKCGFNTIKVPTKEVCE
jgi:hypothetical protein